MEILKVAPRSRHAMDVTDNETSAGAREVAIALGILGLAGLLWLLAGTL